MIQIITSQIAGSENRPMLVDLRLDEQFSNQPVVVFVHGFKGFKDWGHFQKVGEEFAKKGFAFVESSPLVRSSYHAEKHINA